MIYLIWDYVRSRILLAPRTERRGRREELRNHYSITVSYFSTRKTAAYSSTSPWAHLRIIASHITIFPRSRAGLFIVDCCRARIRGAPWCNFFLAHALKFVKAEEWSRSLKIHAYARWTQSHGTTCSWGPRCKSYCLSEYGLFLHRRTPTPLHLL